MYTQHISAGEYYFPNLTLPEGTCPFGKWGPPSHKLNLGDGESIVAALRGLRRCEPHGRYRCSDGIQF